MIFQLAAIRIVKYWEKRLDLFGPEKAFLPLTLDGALKDDLPSLKIGFIRVTCTSDDSNRGLLFVDPSRLPESGTYDRKSMARSTWYYLHALLEDENVQKKGAVIIGYPRKAKFSQFDRKFAKMNMESIKGCIPIRVAGIHMCQPPTFFEIIFPIMKILMGARLRKRVKVHSGSNEKILAKLEDKYG